MSTNDVHSAAPPEAYCEDMPWLDREFPDIEGYVKSLPRQPDYDLVEALRGWRRDGMIVLKNAVSIDLIDQYLEDIEHLIDNFGDYEIPLEVRGAQLSSRELDSFPRDMTGIKLNHMQCFSRAASRLSLTPMITEFLGHVFRSPASACQSLTFWRGSEQPIHIDYPYVRQQSKLSYLAASWIPLEDVDPRAGPLAYYAGGHKLTNSGFFDWGGGSIVDHAGSVNTPAQFASYLARQMERSGIDAQTFCPKQGDALIWHGNLPHEGTAVQDRLATRKSYVTHYTAETCLPEWMRNFDEAGNPVGVFENDGFSYKYKWFDGMKTLPSWND